MLLAATRKHKTAEILLVLFYGKDLNMCNIIYSYILHLRAAIAQSIQLDGPGIESRWGEIYPWGPLSLLHNGYRVFPVGKAAGA